MRDVDRILDANLNRAGEALRVVEDYARFALADAAAARALKGLRHRLARIRKALGPRGLRARDAASDVGREPDPAKRPYRAVADVLAANFRRLAEALRSVEEWVRLDDVALSREAGAARFAAYRLESRLLAAADPRARLARARLYVLLSRDLASGPLERVACAALEGGADVLQLREKAMDGRALAALAGRLARLARRRGALFIVNDRADVAAACGADGVHLGGDDLPIPAARRLLGPSALIGATSHALREARAALSAGADYVSVGPVFPTATKPGLAPAGLGYVRQAARELEAPWFAIGGIGPENVRRVVRAGARRVAVCSAAIGARDPRAAVRALRRALDRAPRRGRHMGRRGR
jgi:thiamine-phosphate pyrophosphorylase